MEFESANWLVHKLLCAGDFRGGSAFWTRKEICTFRSRWPPRLLVLRALGATINTMTLGGMANRDRRPGRRCNYRRGERGPAPARQPRPGWPIRSVRPSATWCKRQTDSRDGERIVFRGIEKTPRQ